MKKAFMLIMVAAVMATALGVNVGTANAASSSVVIYLPGVTQDELKGASMFVNSDDHPVECTLKDEETGRVVCHVPGKYAGEEITLYVAGQTFYAKVPAPNGSNKIACAEDEVLWYSFDVYVDGEYLDSDEMPAWYWEELKADGFFEYLESLGATFWVTGTFCDLEFESPT